RGGAEHAEVSRLPRERPVYLGRGQGEALPRASHLCVLRASARTKLFFLHVCPLVEQSIKTVNVGTA
ncbi:MAG: hypothetical protein NDI74_11325, partial [Sphingomonas sp.]|uniref:hypothetical protein n=1 Tax=Sphingomonas sp. TaxID=28214 RepID=UPI0025838118